MDTYLKINSKQALLFCTELFKSYGFNGEESRIISDVLLSADFAGIESHGVQRIVRYHDEIVSGCVDVRAEPENVFQTDISAVIDAHKAMGQLAGVQAMHDACLKAKRHGFGIVSVRNSNHIGICGYYAEIASKEGLIGICMTNSEAIAVPTFGCKGMLGTNAIAFAMDASPAPFSFDISTTVVPRGKIEVYAKNRENLPAGWAVDTAGRETVSPSEVIQNIVHKSGGGILPLGGAGTLTGGHKGFGLGIIVDIFTGVLSGGLTSNHVNLVKGETGIANCFIALDCNLFGNPQEIKERLSCFLQELRDSPKAEGCERIFTPGEKKAELTAQRRKGTIPVSESTLKELREIAACQGIEFII
ncbi:MAG: Ldh family oxidoreductase [Spirochaetaceae bacterium]|jgi:LDH2 family malate/lactate/ureidoglycolate dehydrogenase|nr:Ldh family oxidoreductase [Spirochaetaceae bacterium]